MVTGKFNARSKNQQNRILATQFGQFMALVLCQKWKYHLENALKAIFAFQFTLFFSCTFILIIGNEMHAYTFLVFVIRSRSMNHRVIFAVFGRKPIYVFSFFIGECLLNIIYVFRSFIFVQIDFFWFIGKKRNKNHLLSPVLDGSSVHICFFLRLAPFAFSL